MTSTDLSIQELAVCAALERLALENARSAETARKSNEKDDARFFQRASNAYARALEEYRDYGVRPEALVSGGWQLPSRTDGQPHLLTMDGDWRCSCRATDSMHWAKALIIGLEVAGDDLDRFDSADDVLCSMPDNLCSVEAPCPAHAAASVEYLTRDLYWSDGTPVPLSPPAWLVFEQRIAA